MDVYRWGDRLGELREPEAIIQATIAKCGELPGVQGVLMRLGATRWRLGEDGQLIAAELGDNDAERSEPSVAVAFHVEGDWDGEVVVAGSPGSDLAGSLRTLQMIARQSSLALTSVLRLRKWHAESQARRHESLHDPLTGLANRSLLSAWLDVAVAKATTANPTTVIVVDLDGFKDLNAAHGDGVGDAILVEVARRIEACGDGVAQVARLGDDEFAVLREDSPTELSSVEIANKLIAAVDRPFEISGSTLRLTATLGISKAPQDANNAAELLGKAEVARGHASSSRRRVVTYGESLDHDSKRRMEMTANLRDAIDANRLEVWYQPVARLDDGIVTGIEALARWSDPATGYISPSEFIPIAEQYGIIERLTWWVLATALGDLVTLRANGFDLTLAINVSAGILHGSELLQRVSQALQAHGIPADKLLLEVTESAFISEEPLVEETLCALSDLGVHVAIDDFGTGYSSLARLRNLPVDTIKVDRSFVSAMSFDGADAAIVKAILDLARSLGHSVVAEGVEELETWDTLKALGCDLMQGYVLAPALPMGTVQGWLASHGAGIAWSGHPQS